MITFPALFTLLIGCAGVCTHAAAANVPRPTAQDDRVRVVTYDPKQVTAISVSRGVVTRIVLESDERIVSAMTGLSARCANDDDEWCILAEKGTNQLFVRPKDRASKTNLELRTNKRDYSMAFSVEGSPSRSFYRVIFEYPAASLGASELTGLRAVLDGPVGSGQALPGEPGAGALNAELASGPTAPQTPSQRLRSEVPQPRNLSYTMQVLPGGDDAAPSLVFDDGRFTFFEFKGTREIPAIFAHGAREDEDPSRVNWHMEPPYIVVERTARRFTLRLGKSVVGIFNEGFDAVGIDTPTGTVSAEVVRVVKEPSNER